MMIMYFVVVLLPNRVHAYLVNVGQALLVMVFRLKWETLPR